MRNKEPNPRTSSRTRFSILCASVAIFVSCAERADGQVDMRLEPAASQPAGAYPKAVLSVANHSAQPVRAVAVRMREGGPTWLWPMAVPPEANSSTGISLPRYAIAQEYVLRALADERADSPAIGTATVTPGWPDDQIGLIRFRRPDLYADHEDKAASWPMGFRRELFIAAAAACIAMAAAVLLRRRAWRLAAVAAVAVGATVAILVWVDHRGDVVQYAVPAPRSADPNVPRASLLIVSSPRTTAWRHPSCEIIPLYQDPEQMAGDDAVIEPGRGISLTLRAGEIRIFLVQAP